MQAGREEKAAYGSKCTGKEAVSHWGTLGCSLFSLFLNEEDTRTVPASDLLSGVLSIGKITLSTTALDGDHSGDHTHPRSQTLTEWKS